MLLCCMKTIKDVFAAYKKDLSDLYEPNEAEALTLLVVSEISDLSKGSIKAFPEMELPANDLEKLAGILDSLKTGQPVQYVLGSTEFYGLSFEVDPSVLIPRPETEELVEWIIESVPRNAGHQNRQILDIGTGSGCIAISLKKNLPEYGISAMDISPAALTTAKKNAAINNVEINFIKQDILLAKSLTSAPYEIIVSNPPYVTQYDKTQMHRNVTDYEPHSALFVPEDDPLLFYSAIADFSINSLQPGGLLFFEINENLGAETVELLKTKGLQHITLRKDMSGRDRMIKAAK